MNLNDYLKTANDLVEGDKIVILCRDKSSAHSLRVRLYKARKISPYKGISISLTELEGKHCIILRKGDDLGEAFVLKGDGSIKELESPSLEEPIISKDFSNPDFRRMIQLAVFDKVPYNEFRTVTEEYFGEKLTEEDESKLTKLWTLEGMKDEERGIYGTFQE